MHRIWMSGESLNSQHKLGAAATYVLSDEELRSKLICGNLEFEIVRTLYMRIIRIMLCLRTLSDSHKVRSWLLQENPFHCILPP